MVEKIRNNSWIPIKGSEDAAGLDLVASNDTVIPPNNGRGLVNTGIAIAMPKGCYGRIAPRSGLACEMGITVGAGTIDNDYRGELKVPLFNHGTQPLKVSTGDRIAQIIVEKCESLQVELVKKLPNTERGAKGFGSSGKTISGTYYTPSDAA